ncbi:tagaturonate epimerase family protein [Pseudogracilibacillus auburnensis]|uniref:tagaturonate epimerase family protein n=1 Tax=Pseudogracilibacillus auburnensis TaxID=1494959 RepID=UPI001A96FB09|nr:tagaturonate epimerase family protein [Pseudogracilibacillus auburnensis]MBO1001713.1 tagaturonate epimerase family protein [Pseudogracilibacillus auburnensis]
MEHLNEVIESLSKGKMKTNIKRYERSFTIHDNVHLMMIRVDNEKSIIAAGKGKLFDELSGETIVEKGKNCPLSHENRLVLNKYFDYTVPKAFGTKTATIGLGDRLGLASPGHIQTVEEKGIKPILAQQSIRELTLTNRTMEEMLDAASFAVFQEGYKGGFGADGDHIKEGADIENALSLGCSMITLDCSDHIYNSIEHANDHEIVAEYEKLSDEIQHYYNNNYLDKTFNVDDLSLTFNQITLMKNVLLYHEAIHYTCCIYDEYITKAEREIDFELSIDETETITSPLSHFFVANELKRHNITITSLAPRFCGEFQKGIDYIGDVHQFEVELREHAFIAAHFGYKLSIHSGSDKFKVYPIIAKHTKGIYHVKTAGTNWLEAVRVIATVNPNLYRKMHTFALENFSEAQKHYHVTPNMSTVLPLEEVKDNELPNYMNNDAARQLFHITYGLLLATKDQVGDYLFRNDVFGTLNDREEEYNKALVKHIGKHLELLGL